MKEMCTCILIRGISCVFSVSFPCQISVITTVSIPRHVRCPDQGTLNVCARLAMKGSSVMSTSACVATEPHVSLMEIQEMCLAS